MLAAKYDRTIVIEKKEKGLNNFGTPSSTYVFLKNKYANVDYRGGNTSSNNYSQRTETDATFSIRYDVDIDYNCRIKYNSAIYQIQHIEIVGRNEAQRIRTTMYEIIE